MAILNKHNTKTFLEDELEEAVFRGAPPIKHSFEDTNGLLKIHMDTPDSATLFIKWDFLKGIGYKGVIFNNYGSGNLYISSGTTWDDNFGLINEGKNKVYISGSNEKGTHFVMDYIPEDFKIYNETGAYMKCELRNDAILKGDICFSNIVLEDYQFLSFTPP